MIPLGGTPSDIVLDESRGKLYLVNSNANRVDVYDYMNRQKLGPITVGQRPLAAAIRIGGGNCPCRDSVVGRYSALHELPRFRSKRVAADCKRCD